MTALIALVSLGNTAHAVLVSSRYCVDYSLDFDDYEFGDLLTGTTTKGRGALVRFVRPDQTYFGYYVDWDGSDPGCASMVADSSVSYTVKIVRQASVNGNIITVRDINGNTFATTVETGFSPTMGGDYGWTVGPGGGVRPMAVATWALQRRSGGITGEDLDFQIIDTGGSYFSSASETVYISTDEDQHRRKYVIAHELGHMLTYFANGSNSPSFSTWALRDDCTSLYSHPGHKMNSKEYQSTAASEGIADFYAAVAFNQDSESDCELQGLGNVDWNADGTIDVSDLDRFSCESAPFSGVNTAGKDFYTEYCQGGLSGEDDNRGTQYDWLRHFWDLTTDHNVGVSTIFEIWDEANPHTWNATGDGTGSNYPSTRLYDAADTVGGSSLQADWYSSMDYNGVER